MNLTMPIWGAFTVSIWETFTISIFVHYVNTASNTLICILNCLIRMDFTTCNYSEYFKDFCYVLPNHSLECHWESASFRIFAGLGFLGSGPLSIIIQGDK